MSPHSFPKLCDEESDGVFFSPDKKPPHFACIPRIFHPDPIRTQLHFQCGDEVQVLEFLTSPLDDPLVFFESDGARAVHQRAAGGKEAGGRLEELSLQPWE